MAKELTEEQMRIAGEAIERAKKAFKVIETYNQARVGRLCQAAAWAVATKGLQAVGLWAPRKAGLAIPSRA